MRSAARSLAERERGLASISLSARGARRRRNKPESGGARICGFRRVARAARRFAGALGEKAFDDAVLQRMEGNHRKPAKWRKRALGRFETAFEFAQFVIHVNAQRLESARGRMDRLAARSGAQHAFDDFSKHPRARDGTRGNNGARNGAGAFFLAITPEDIGKFRFAERVHGIGSAFTRTAHAHVERSVFLEGESAS